MIAVERVTDRRYLVKRFSDEGVLELRGVVERVGQFFIASPAFYGVGEPLIGEPLIGEPLIGEPVQAAFNSFWDAAGVLG